MRTLAFIFFAVSILMSCSSENDNPVNDKDMSRLPEKIEAFIGKHFPDNNIISVKEVLFGDDKSFEIELEGGVVLRFDNSDKLVEIESESKISDSLIPEKIAEYISTHYPSNFIKKWAIEEDSQVIILDNGKELKFELNGDIINEDSYSYIGYDEYSYIIQSDMGRIYARTASGYLVTSERINLLTPGTVALLSFQVDEETEIIKLDDNVNLYKVRLSKEPITLDQETLQLRSAPVVEEPVFFESIIAPPTWVTHSSEYFGDRWPFTYQFKAKKGENASVSFYQVPKDKHPENLNADMLIDIRLEIFGTPQENAQEELKNDLIVANMSRILPTPSEDDDTSDLNNTETEKLNIKYRYFIINSKKEPELYISAPITILVPKTTPK